MSRHDYQWRDRHLADFDGDDASEALTDAMKNALRSETLSVDTELQGELSELNLNIDLLREAIETGFSKLVQIIMDTDFGGRE